MVPLSVQPQEISSPEEDTMAAEKSLLIPQAEPVHSERIIPLHVVSGKLHGVEQSESWEEPCIEQGRPYTVERLEHAASRLEETASEERTLVNESVSQALEEKNASNVEDGKGCNLVLWENECLLSVMHSNICDKSCERLLNTRP